MTEQEILNIKHRMAELIKVQIESEKSKLNILRSYQSKAEKATGEEYTKLSNDVSEMLNVMDPGDIVDLLEKQIEVEKNRLQNLRVFQSQTAASNNEFELKEVHDNLAQMLGIPNFNK